MSEDLPTLGPTLTWPLLAVLAAATLVVALVAALVSRSGHIRLRHWAEEAGGRLLELYNAPRSFEAFRFLLSFLAKALPTVLALALGAQLQATGAPAPPALALGLVALLLFAVEWRSRAIIEHDAESYLRRLTPALRALQALLRPPIWLLARFVTRPEPGGEEVDDTVSEDEIKAYIDVGLREGILEPEERELVRGIVDFGDTRVRSVMTPRVEMVSASVDEGLEELAAIFFDSKHARLPLYRDSVDHIVGILHIRDLFQALHDSSETDAARLSKPPHFVPESKNLRELLTELQALRQQMAIVVDEYGGVAGLVTVEDLVEEIVGDINDEHEEEEAAWEVLADGGLRLEGRVYLEDLDERFGTDFDEISYETVSGLICGELGYVPKAGEVFEKHGLSFTVEEADERRVLRVAVRQLQPAEEAREEVESPPPETADERL